MNIHTEAKILRTNPAWRNTIRRRPLSFCANEVSQTFMFHLMCPLQLCLSNFKAASKPLSVNLDGSGTGCAESHRILIGQEMSYC